MELLGIKIYKMVKIIERIKLKNTIISKNTGIIFSLRKVLPAETLKILQQTPASAQITPSATDTVSERVFK